MWRLVHTLLTTSAKTEHWTPKTDFIIGRSGDPQRMPDISLQTPNDEISRQHLHVWQDTEGQWWLEDMESVNKTYFNGKPLVHHTKLKLDSHMCFQLAKHSELQFFFEPSEDPTPPLKPAQITWVLRGRTYSYAFRKLPEPFVKKITLTNPNDVPLHHVHVEISLGDFITYSSNEIEVIGAGATVSDAFLMPLEPRENGQYLSFLNSLADNDIRKVNVKAEVFAKQRSIPLERSRQRTVQETVDILPRANWDPWDCTETLAAFVDPASKALIPITRQVADALNDKGWGSNKASTKHERIAKEFYNTLKGYDRIRYSAPPVTYKYQLIRRPQEVLQDDEKGTCIDLVTLFSACLESQNIPSVLLLLKQNQGFHILVGFWRKRPDDISYRITPERVQRELEAENLCVLEVTEFAKPDILADVAENHKDNQFAHALETGYTSIIEALKKPNELYYALDMKDARKQGIKSYNMGFVDSDNDWDSYYTRRARRILSQAYSQCFRLGGGAVDVHHLLLALLDLQDGILSSFLSDQLPDELFPAAQLMQDIQDRLTTLSRVNHNQYTDRFDQVILEAHKLKKRADIHKKTEGLVDEEHLLCAALDSLELDRDEPISGYLTVELGKKFRPLLYACHYQLIKRLQ